MLSRQPRANPTNRQNGGNRRKQQGPVPVPVPEETSSPSFPSTTTTSLAPVFASSLQFLPSSLTGMAPKRTNVHPLADTTATTTATTATTTAGGGSGGGGGGGGTGTVPNSLRPGTPVKRNTPDRRASTPSSTATPPSSNPSFTNTNTNTNTNAPGGPPTETAKPRMTRNLWQPLRRTSSNASASSNNSSSGGGGRASRKDSSSTDKTDRTDKTLAEELDQMILDSESAEREREKSGGEKEMGIGMETESERERSHLSQIQTLQLDLLNARLDQQHLSTSLDRLRVELEESTRARGELEESLRLGEEEIRRLGEEKEEFRRGLGDLGRKLEMMEDGIQEESEQARKVVEEEKRGLEGAKREVEDRVERLVREKGEVEMEKDGLREELRGVKGEIGRVKEDTRVTKVQCEELQRDLNTLKEEKREIEEQRDGLRDEKNRVEEEKLAIEEVKEEVDNERLKLERDLADAMQGRSVLEKKEECAHESQVLAERRALEERRARVRVEESLKGMEAKMNELAQKLESAQAEIIRNGSEQGRIIVGQQDRSAGRTNLSTTLPEASAGRNPMLTRARDAAESWNRTAENTLQAVYTRFQGFQTIFPGGGGGAANATHSIARFWGSRDHTTTPMTSGRSFQKEKVLFAVKNAEEEVKRATGTLSEAIRKLDLAERQAEKENYRETRTSLNLAVSTFEPSIISKLLSLFNGHRHRQCHVDGSKGLFSSLFFSALWIFALAISLSTLSSRVREPSAGTKGLAQFTYYSVGFLRALTKIPRPDC
ncbi:hypothetical protein K435DRAFT_801619 [Dendrothele bispora CBS 962.96]|uniref:Uncharacterized protein n=1 Tax=Dendrothele bispora (strain CBS 962.96) TaxID=1314807 RepID=A0A4S8LNM2_DENBC|nr:hypothetical protein K435DRAFT_801619 [Dendrothele bispora CBS 962.96]